MQGGSVNCPKLKSVEKGKLMIAAFSSLLRHVRDCVIAEFMQKCAGSTCRHQLQRRRIFDMLQACASRAPRLSCGSF